MASKGSETFVFNFSEESPCALVLWCSGLEFSHQKLHSVLVQSYVFFIYLGGHCSWTTQ